MKFRETITFTIPEAESLKDQFKQAAQIDREKNTVEVAGYTLQKRSCWQRLRSYIAKDSLMAAGWVGTLDNPSAAPDLKKKIYLNYGLTFEAVTDKVARYVAKEQTPQAAKDEALLKAVQQRQVPKI